MGNCRIEAFILCIAQAEASSATAAKVVGWLEDQDGSCRMFSTASAVSYTSTTVIASSSLCFALTCFETKHPDRY